MGKPRNELPQRGSLGPDSQGRGGPATIVGRFVSERNQRIDRPPFDGVTPSPDPAGNDAMGTKARQYDSARRDSEGSPCGAGGP